MMPCVTRFLVCHDSRNICQSCRGVPSNARLALIPDEVAAAVRIGENLFVRARGRPLCTMIGPMGSRWYMSPPKGFVHDGEGGPFIWIVENQTGSAECGS